VKDSLFGEENSAVASERNQPFSFSNLSRDTFSINLDYRDPFGETEKSYSPEPPQSSSENPNNAPLKRVIPRTVQWPEIVYYGQVRKTTSKDPLAIISIDGYKHTIRKGERLYDGIKINSIGRDSMVVVYQKEKRVYWR
jgi:hypothetical protein